MKRADKPNDHYRGRRPKAGLTAGQAAIVMLLVIAAILAMTVHASSHWTGHSCCEVLPDAWRLTGGLL